MSKSVICTFNSREAAERAVNDLRGKGFDKEISVIAKDDQGKMEKKQYDAPRMGGDTVTDGTATGGVIGGLAGLAMGAGALAIPGLGPIIAAGPIAGLLSGAAAGGIAGGLVDFGVPEERSRHFEDKVRQGHVLVALKSDEKRINEAADLLRRSGAQDVEVH
ncbi:MAG: hypothetical protein AB1815_13250 [Bacillota bacterium]|jgi:uncharacterized membrane protein